jgi:hypothetical protein
MLRYVLNGKQLIIRIAQRLSLNGTEREEIYKKVLSVGDRLLNVQNETQIILKDDKGSNIILDIKYGELVVITIQYIIEKEKCLFIDGFADRQFKL